MSTQSSALVIYSGGQDSTTCLFWAKRNFKRVEAVTFDYNQRHRAEIGAAATICGKDHANVPHHLIKLGPVLTGSSPLVSQQKLEQYADMHSLPGGLEKTFVPGRNLLFLTIAANLAHSLGIKDVVTGVCQEDYGGYPDCRQIFINGAQHTIRTGFSLEETDLFWNFEIHTPLMNMTKAETCWMAMEDHDCWKALAYTHTSYDGAYPPTGQDHATLLRAKGFFEANLPDPLVVRAWREGKMGLPDSVNYEGVRHGAPI